MSDEPVNMLDPALSYAARGWHLIPNCNPVELGGKYICTRHLGCGKIGKQPLIKGWAQDKASCDQTQVRSWWGTWPGANIGVLCGARSGIAVLDVDQHGADGAATLQGLVARHGELPRTPCSRTGGGGMHYFFAYQSSIVPLPAGKYPGLELRMDRQQVILPPSLHASGRRYEWIVSPDDAPLAEMPEWLRALGSQREHAGDGQAGGGGQPPTPGGKSHDHGGAVGRDFEIRRSWESILSPAGWQIVRRDGGKLEWARPGKRDTGATTNFADSDLLYVFTTSAPPFEAGGTYTKFEVYCLLYHQGNREAAIKALEADGYGPGQLVEGLPRTDLGNAERLVAFAQGRLRYTPAHGWLVWDGTRWAEDSMGAAKRICGEMVRELQDKLEGRRDPMAQAERQWLVRSESNARVVSMLSLAECQPEFATPPEYLDANPWLLSCLNGTIDLRTGKLRRADPRDLLCKRTAVLYDPQAACPKFEEFLRLIMGDDQELIGFVQRWFGYSLTGFTGEQLMLVAYGSGCNGKSTLFTTIGRVLGDYYMALSSGTLTYKRVQADPGNPRPDIVQCDRVRLAVSNEVRQGCYLDEVMVKRLVSGNEMIRERQLYKDYRTLNWQAKLALLTNHLPHIQGTDWAIWRRVLLIPFNYTFSVEQRILDYDQILFSEEGPGILNWMIQGCLDWQQGGLRVPDSIKAATEQYRSDEDELSEWWDACVERSQYGSVTRAALYRAYVDWIRGQGGRPVSAKSFARQVRERGVIETKTRTERYWKGIRLSQTGNQALMAQVSGESNDDDWDAEDWDSGEVVR